MSAPQTAAEKAKQIPPQQSLTGLTNSHPLPLAPALQRYTTLPQVSAPRLSPSLLQISQNYDYNHMTGRSQATLLTRDQNLGDDYPTLIELLKDTFSAGIQSGSPTFTSFASGSTTSPRDPNVGRTHAGDQASLKDLDIRPPRDAIPVQKCFPVWEPHSSTAFPSSDPPAQWSLSGGDSSGKFQGLLRVHGGGAALDSENQAKYPLTTQSSSVQATQGRTSSYDRSFPIQEDPDDDLHLAAQNVAHQGPECPGLRRASSQLNPSDTHLKRKRQHFEPCHLKPSVKEPHLVNLENVRAEIVRPKMVRPKHSRLDVPSLLSPLPPGAYALGGGGFGPPSSIAQVPEYYPHPFEHIRRNALSQNAHPRMLDTPNPDFDMNAPRDRWKTAVQWQKTARDAYESDNTSDSTFSAPATPFQDNFTPWARWDIQRSLKRAPDSRSTRSNPDKLSHNPAFMFWRKKHRVGKLGTGMLMKVPRLRGSQPRNSSPEPPSSDEEPDCSCDEHDERVCEEEIERERESEWQGGQGSFTTVG
ncbi:hypothetical protein P691DRAFT_130652 [Macrolepiota fuliginosa MF-IS2]|uniref:Uncharacterized protein n=1 Tax=Macrolepiota fuliginosa MF-IS2 TaxID=1400762 RepID=A0A9P5XA37_9AGAR|nr:hypothetical protein P691DRAFT_130652 [Macrolepiota fuliginosa MF-IS2]